MNMWRIAVHGLVATAGTFAVVAEGASADKTDYSPANPTPKALWRELSADRPDVTESPITVDAGVWQVEMSFFDVTRQGADEAIALAPTNIKLGLRHNLDLQLVLGPYVRDVAGGEGGTGGLGDTELRLKYNVWGNDGGETALGLMPFIKLPTATNDMGNGKVEGGLILPFACDLGPRTGLGMMLKADAVYDEEDESYDAEWTATSVIGVAAGDRVGFYFEGIATLPADGPSMQGVLGLGATYTVSEDAMLDLGCNIGLTEDADDFNAFGGITLRF